MKIALDPYMLRNMPLLELPGVVADLGYEYIELSPREDFLPFFLHPRANRRAVRGVQGGAGRRGVEVASVLPLYAGRARTRTSGRRRCATGSGPSRSPWTWAAG